MIQTNGRVELQEQSVANVTMQANAPKTLKEAEKACKSYMLRVPPRTFGGMKARQVGTAHRRIAVVCASVAKKTSQKEAEFIAAERELWADNTSTMAQCCRMSPAADRYDQLSRGGARLRLSHG